MTTEKPAVKILEIDRGASLPDWTEDDSQAIKTLDGHPGFEALKLKLRFCKNALQSTFEKTKSNDITDYIRLQEGIRWLAFVEAFVKSEVGKVKQPKPRNPFEIEEELLAKVSGALEIVGAPK